MWKPHPSNHKINRIAKIVQSILVTSGQPCCRRELESRLWCGVVWAMKLGRGKGRRPQKGPAEQIRRFARDDKIRKPFTLQNKLILHTK
jgi:hypothetical protein